MFEQLAEAIENLTVPAGARALEELLWLRDRLEARAVEALGGFIDSELWDTEDAATSPQAWLRDHVRMTTGQAHRLVVTAKRTRPLPATCGAWMSGTVSGGQVEVILQNIGKHRAVFADHEDAVLPAIAESDLAGTIEFMQEWRERVDALQPIPDEPLDPPSRVFLSNALDGRGMLNGDFDADDNAVVTAALRVATVQDLPEEPTRTAAERRADAWVAIAQYFLANQQTRTGGRHTPHVNVLVDVDRFEGRDIDGSVLSKDTIERLMCDCAFHRVLFDRQSGILDVGMATRVLTAAMWTALVARDQHCRFPGCDRRSTWCDGHHVVWFSRGGPTAIDNLVLLCRRHHRRLHQPGWHAKLLPDSTFEVTFPSGQTRTSQPPGTLDLCAPPDAAAA